MVQAIEWRVKEEQKSYIAVHDIPHSNIQQKEICFNQKQVGVDYMNQNYLCHSIYYSTRKYRFTKMATLLLYTYTSDSLNNSPWKVNGNKPLHILGTYQISFVSKINDHFWC